MTYSGAHRKQSTTPYRVATKIFDGDKLTHGRRKV